MVWPPTGSTYYPEYNVADYYDANNVYRRHFTLWVRDWETIQVAADFDMQLDAFNAIDTSQNGYISIPEWRTWMGLAGSGTLSVPLTTTDYDSIFASLDTGDPLAGNYGAYDGKLSFEEFQYVIGVQLTV
jgi:hypothetical protein